MDSADPDRFEEARTALGMCFVFLSSFFIVTCAFRVEHMQRHPDLEGIPILVLANKQDLETAETTRYITEKLTMAQYDAQACVVHPVSALTQEGIDDGLNWLIEQVKTSDRYRNRSI